LKDSSLYLRAMDDAQNGDDVVVDSMGDHSLRFENERSLPGRTG
jgi:hypothetical protein